VVEEVARTIPGAERVDVGASKHKIQLERHQAVNRAIERFILADVPEIALAGRRAMMPQSWAGPGSKPTTMPRQERCRFLIGPLPEFLASAADWLPKRPAVIFQDSKLTYAQLNQRANQFAHTLRGLGIRPGDRVMLYLPNMPELIIAFYGVLRAGGVVVLPSLRGDAAQMVEEARSTAAELFVTLPQFGALGQTLQAHAEVREVLTATMPRALSPNARHAMWQSLGHPADTAQNEMPAAGRPAQ
jgi:long-chain acyl-CoA synthetase